MGKYLFFSLLLVCAYSLNGQDIWYVNADNGLIIRDQPDRAGNKIGKLIYGSSVFRLRETNTELAIQDGEDLIRGNWVEIEEVDGQLRGYVFSGYLTSDPVNKRIEMVFDDLTLVMDLGTWKVMDYGSTVLGDTARVYLDLGDTPENKLFTLKHTEYKEVRIFQRHENSVTISQEGPHCDLFDWKHYYSDWKELEFDPVENSFTSNSYNQNDWRKFIEVEIDELIEAVELTCGEEWSQLLGHISDVNEYPSGVSMSKIIIKLVLTKQEGPNQEKIIEFEIPMGC